MSEADHLMIAFAVFCGVTGVAIGALVHCVMHQDDVILGLRRKSAQLEGALKPLARCEIIEPDVRIPDHHGARYFMTYGEIRRARAALAQQRGPA